MPQHAAPPDPIDVGSLREPGQVRAVDEPGFRNAFVARVASPEPPPRAVPADKEGEYFVAFSRLCTHMGAYLLGTRHKKLGSIAEEGVVRCPAHLTCFDLRHGGLVVIGQACASLSQIELRPDGPGRLRLVRWTSPPYGEVDP